MAQGATSATFAIATAAVTTTTATSIVAAYGGVTRTASFTVNAPVAPPPSAPALASLAIAPASVAGGATAIGTVTLDRAAASGGASVALASSDAAIASVPASVTVPAGAVSATFNVRTYATKKNRTPTISASYGGVTKTFSLVVKRR